MNLVRIAAVGLIVFPLIACGADNDDDAHQPGLNARTFEGLEWRGIGPALMSGRIADLVIHPEHRATWYVAVGSGGLWKTNNHGTTWESIFDAQDSWSIGSVTLDPNDPEVVWVGSGENVSGRHVGYGDGVYKSVDGGTTWSNMGLETSEHIGMIRVDPRDSDVVYVAAQGPLWSGGGERGLYKTNDGGATWQRILAAGAYTGVSEVHLDPRDPDVVYAVTHQRLRNVAALINGGPESGIHKSVDGGETWQELTAGLPEQDMGKIGLAISPQRPDVIYATIELARRKGGFWRSDDGGMNWEKRSDYLSSGTGPHYYQELFASPHEFDRVYQMDVRMHVTEDGGLNFVKVPQQHKHGDHHALAFAIDDPGYLLSGTDGGVYESYDLGQNWRFVANLPVTQFYKLAVDYDEPFYNVYGGTQDNNTQGGPSRTPNASGIRNSDWFVTLTGDGHQPAADPSNPDIVYSQWQQGNLVRYDRSTGEYVYIQPQPAAGEPGERWNWDSPILISPHDPARLYFASQRVWRSDDRGDSWRPISSDLSRDQDRLKLPIMGRVWSYDSSWDLYAMSKYGNVTSLSESPLVEGLIYAGTDDGLVQVSEDGGANWRRIDRLPGVPEGFFVNDVKADLHDADTVYVVVDNHKFGDLRPFVLKSTNRGRSWKSVAGDLPERHIVWRLVQDHVKPELLFVGTEFGVFFTIDGGEQWVKLSGGAPNISFRDLVIQTRENDLVGATFGRSFWILDDYTPLREISADALRDKVMLFPIRETRWYVERHPLGQVGKASQGEAFFVAPNPPFAAVFTYYLPEEIKTRQALRRAAEEPIETAGGDTPYPGWDTLREEAREDTPTVVLTVRDNDGNIVRHVEGPVTAGFHRVAWDLRYPTVKPWKDDEGDPPWRIPKGALAPPGTYSVSLSKRTDGEALELAPAQTFVVRSIRQPVLPGATPEEMTAFVRRVHAAQRSTEGAVAAIDDVVAEIAAIKVTLPRGTGDPALHARSHAIEKQARDLREQLAGDEERSQMGDVEVVSIKNRIDAASTDKAYSAYGPTPTQMQTLEIAEAQYAEVREALNRLMGQDLPELRKELDAAGVPWTPGRGAAPTD